MRAFGYGEQARVAQYQKISRWLAARPQLWRAKKIEHNNAEHIAIAKALIAAGFYSKKTSVVDIKVPKILKIMAHFEKH